MRRPEDLSVADVAGEIARRGAVVAMTGAGISVDSGIPDFRSPGGLWDRFDPMEYAHIQAFHANPEKIWNMLREMQDMVENAKPNPGHIGLAELERMGLLGTVVTQNVDGLHQAAGNTDVVEFHGNNRYLVCLRCDKRYGKDAVPSGAEAFPPRCDCSAILKPDVVFFGEAIPRDAQVKAHHAASQCKVMLVVGTSAVVFPASQIPVVAKQSGAFVVEVNLEKTELTRSVSDAFLEGSSSVILPELVDAVRAGLH